MTRHRLHNSMDTSVLLSSANLKHLERMSPTAGPPSTRTISAVLPPSSDTGSTCATLVVKLRKVPASLASDVSLSPSWSLYTYSARYGTSRHGKAGLSRVYPLVITCHTVEGSSSAEHK